MLTATLATSLVALSVVAAPPSTDRRGDADRLRDEGDSAYAAKDYARAVKLLTESYDLFPSSRTLYNLALAREQMGDIAGAAEAVTDYLGRRDRDPASGAARWLGQLERRLRRTHGHVRIVLTPSGTRFRLAGRALPSPWGGWLPPGSYTLVVDDPTVVGVEQFIKVAKGTRQSVDLRLKVEPVRLVLKANAPGAQVWLDGREVGKTPLELNAISPGDREIVVRAEGFAPWKRLVAVATAGPTVVNITLRRVPDKTIVGRPHDALEPTPEPVVPDPPLHWQQPTGWTLVGLGLTAGATGLGLHLAHVVDAASLADLDARSPEYASKYAEIADSNSSALIAPAILYGVGAVAVAAGAVILILDGQGQVSVGPGTLLVGGRF
jgi:tetratricopeptide (TPR) repeat protein